MRQFQLRTYRLRTPEAAVVYLLHWQRHINSLRRFGVETHGFFRVPSAPNTVTALVSMSADVDPEEVTREYLQSRDLRDDMEGYDVSQIEVVETLSLEPGPGSPLT